MNLLDRIKAGIAAFASGSYDAATYSSRRARVPGTSPTDHKLEFTGFDRLELIKKARYLRKNTGFYREITNNLALYAVGRGIWPQATTESREWNRDAEALFREWAKTPELSGRFSYCDVQKLLSKSIDTDGEVFVLKTRAPVTKVPKIQLIESHRFGNFQGQRDISDNVFDGVKINPKTGAVVSYRMLGEDGLPRDIKAYNILHLFDPECPSAYRHAPSLAHAINHLIDEGELLALEKHAVKDNADITRVLKVDGGKLDESGDFSFDADAEYEASNPNALQQITGGKLVALQPHEDLVPFQPSRPSPTFTGFLTHLRRDSALGVMPYEFAIDPGAVGGAGIRLVVSKAQRMIDDRTEMIATRFVVPLWFYVIGTAIDNGELPPIKGWANVKTRSPRRMTVDAGRDEESLRRNIEIGLRTAGDAYAEAGEDFLVTMERKAEELVALQQIASKHNLKVKDLYSFGAEEATEEPEPTPGMVPPGGPAGTPPSAPPPDPSKPAPQPPQPPQPPEKR